MVEPLRPRLRDGVESVVGMDDHVLLHDTVTGQYHRLGSTAAAVVDRFDGELTTADLAALLRTSGGASVDAGRIERLIDSLRDKALLEGTEPPRRRRGMMSWVLPRFLVWRGFGRVLAPIVAGLSRLPLVPLGIAACVAAVLGYVAGFTVLAHQGLALDRAPTRAFFIAAGIQLLGVLLHESWHGIVAGVQGHPIRGLGFALVLWVAPVAYVDRTDSYQVRSRAGRCSIAVAGMVSDGWVCGLTAFLALRADGTWATVAGFLLTFQLLMLLANLNPFIPSDTVGAVEAATGLIDIRGKSMAYLKHRVLGRELPPALARAARRTRFGYAAYGMAALVFAVFVLVTFAAGIVLSIQRALETAGS